MAEPKSPLEELIEEATKSVSSAENERKQLAVNAVTNGYELATRIIIPGGGMDPVTLARHISSCMLSDYLDAVKKDEPCQAKPAS